MGKGLYIQLVNATGLTFTLDSESCHSHQVFDWTPPPTLAPNTASMFYAEFEMHDVDRPWFKYIDDSAVAVYTSPPGFSMKIDLKVKGVKHVEKAGNSGGYGVGVTWAGIQDLFVYPPPDPTGFSSVGWVHDGVVTIAVAEASGNVSQIPLSSAYPTPDAKSGQWDNDLTALRPSVKHWATNWMDQYWPFLSQLALYELTIPGTHDSGTWGARIPTQQAQYLSIADQLAEGVRSLDLRWAVEEKNGSYEFRIIHGPASVGKLKVTLDAVLDQLTHFLSRTSREIVILDMHSFEGDGWTLAAFEAFAGKIITRLNTTSPLLIGRLSANMTLGEIWDSTGRVVVGMRSAPAEVIQYLDDLGWFWTSSVQQKWSGEEGPTFWGTIRDWMDSVLNPLTEPIGYLWSIMAQYNHGNDTPAYVPQELSQYFSVGTDGIGENGLKANIIAIDWWDRCNSENKLSSQDSIPNFATLTNAVPLNLLKGYRRSQGLSLWNMATNPNLESEWAWCNKCGCLWYVADQNQPQFPCAGGGDHSYEGSMNYTLTSGLYRSAPAQDHWFWCNGCSGVCYSGQQEEVTSVCPGATTDPPTHALNLGTEYWMFRNYGGESAQGSWHLCQKCAVLFWYEPNVVQMGPCPAGGVHAMIGRPYKLAINPAPLSPADAG